MFKVKLKNDLEIIKIRGMFITNNIHDAIEVGIAMITVALHGQAQPKSRDNRRILTENFGISFGSWSVTIHEESI